MRSKDLSGNRDVSQRELRQFANASGSGFRLLQPDLCDDEAVLRGDYRQTALRPGLVLHATDVHEIYDLHTQTLQRPGLTISLFLQGGVTAWLGDRPFVMGAPDGIGPAPAEAVAFMKARPESFARRSVRGTHVRKVNVTVTPEWLEEGGLDGLSGYDEVLRFSRNHLTSARWRASTRLITLAEQILHPPKYSPLLQNLYCESRAIEFVGEALQAISQSDEEARTLSLRSGDLRRIQAVCEFIEAHLDATFDLQTVAREAGMGVNTLQRLFRSVHNTTVFDYVRVRKLERARAALELEGVSVAQAAFIAGYTSPANFATAFKRFFGTSPKNVRA